MQTVTRGKDCILGVLGWARGSTGFEGRPAGGAEMLRARLVAEPLGTPGWPALGVGEPCEGCLRGPAAPLTGAVIGLSAPNAQFIELCMLAYAGTNILSINFAKGALACITLQLQI